MQHIEMLLSIKLQHQLFVDPKRIRLLKEIQQSGSISQAAKNAKVSYKSAWDHLAAMNALSPKPLFERNIGGKNGGGTVLTPYAERLLQLYDLLEKTQQNAFEILQDEQISLDSLLTATAKFSPQSSARNQFLGKVTQLVPNGIYCDVVIEIANFSQNLTACITQTSRETLQLTLGKEVMVMAKAPWLTLHLHKPPLENSFVAQVQQIVDQGETQEISLSAEGLCCFATVQTGFPLCIGEQVWVSIDPKQIVLFALSHTFQVE